ncbi:hypothetical protein J2Z22_001198 [Paenibacillus forsythiae]|uniref:YgiT-type zinc finger protein n=1 Tax=Paenibacillus forsythiae TaxID=365616 RepID=A0ABU3H4C3_9BACL|nr:hypothetical protein [Paenibacillus forsythiae]MDT3425679.1 hypothetical protein [Paenibacillus forsythiae]
MCNESKLYRTCRCGGVMTIHMHTLIYKAKVKISRVPVFMCRTCFQYEPHPAVKRDLSLMIQNLGSNPEITSLSFIERNEWASVLNDTFNGFQGEDHDLEQAVQQAMSARIDLLLDLFRIASEAADPVWMGEIESRLLKLISHTASKVS